MGQKDLILDLTTTNAYQDSRKSQVKNWGTKLLLIKNTGDTNGLTYIIKAYADGDDDDSEHTLLSATNLAHSSGIIYKTTDPWDVIYVQVKSQVDGSHTDCKIWCNRGVHA